VIKFFLEKVNNETEVFPLSCNKTRHYNSHSFASLSYPSSYDTADIVHVIADTLAWTVLLTVTQIVMWLILGPAKHIN